jgi:carboxypeptidase family protein/TonB-dependent receptor-like protein
MKTMSKNLWLFVALLVFAASSAFAATQNAVVYGTVYDATGTPLPGVSVSLENPALGFSRSTTSGSDGSYNFAEVPPAEGYRLTAARGGNKIDIRSGITVNVGDERVILPPLKEQPVVAAATGAKHEVKETKLESQGVRNETVSTAISGVITGDQLRSLPLYNRNFLALGLLTPNTHDVEGGSDLNGASFSVNGQRPSSNNFLLDGADNVASSSNQAIPFQVNDSIQEFRVTSSTANAEYGRAGGGTVNVVTRRGGNQFHGSAYGYFGSDALNSDGALSSYSNTTFAKAAAYAGDPTVRALGAQQTVFPLRYNDYVNSAIANGFCTDQIGVTGTTTPCITGGTGANTFFDPSSVLAANNSHSQPFNSKQFGVNGGGAIIKDKLFVFGSYEGTLIDNPNPIFERVPSQFDKSYAPIGSNPTFLQTDPNFVLGQNVLGLFPSANVVGVPGALEFFQGTAPNYTNVHNFLGRADYTQTDKTNWNVRYALQNLNQLHDDSLPKQSQYPGNGAIRDVLNQSVNLSMGHSFTTALINEARVGFTRFDLKDQPQDRHFDATSVGLPNPAMQSIFLNGIDETESGASPAFFGVFSNWGGCPFGGPCSNSIQAPTLNYLFPMARIGAPLTAPSARRDTTLYAADNISWTKGKHGFKAGFEYRDQDNRFHNGAFSRGFIYSSNIGEFTRDSVAPSNFARPSFDFAYRQPDDYAANLRSYNVGWYVQDTWRFHPRWTLNLGVRWDYFSVPTEAHKQLYNFDAAANGLVQEGASAVVDPFGFACGGTVDDNALPGGILTGIPWTCSASTNGSNKLAKSDKNNFAPRLGIAWDVFGTGNTVVRFGTGLFYDQRPASDYAQLMFNRPTTFDPNNPQFILGQTGGSGGFSGFGGFGNTSVDPAVIVANGTQADQSTAEPFAMYALDTRHTDTPYTWQWTGTLQQSISKNVSIEFGYVGARGYLLPVLHNENFGNQYTDEALVSDNIRKFPAFTISDRGESDYNSFLVRARVAEAKGLRVNFTYNYSRSNDNASSAIFPTVPVSLLNNSLGPQFITTANPSPYCLLLNTGCGTFPLTSPDLNFFGSAVTTTGQGQVVTSRYTIPQNPFNYLTDDRGPSDFDSRQRFVVDYTWDLPFSKKHVLTNNWAVSGIFTAQSGQPYTIFGGPIYGEVTERVNTSGAVQLDNNNPGSAIRDSGISLASCAVSGSIFSNSPLLPSPNTACTGSSKRNQFVGPNYINMNFAIQKGFKVFGEGRMLTVRSEFYNLFDRANYYNPISQYSVDGFNFNPEFGQIKSAHDPRQIQLAVRFNW